MFDMDDKEFFKPIRNMTKYVERERDITKPKKQAKPPYRITSKDFHLVIVEDLFGDNDE